VPGLWITLLRRNGGDGHDAGQDPLDAGGNGDARRLALGDTPHFVNTRCLMLQWVFWGGIIAAVSAVWLTIFLLAMLAR
jgi:hypothetical protein